MLGEQGQAYKAVYEEFIPNYGAANPKTSEENLGRNKPSKRLSLNQQARKRTDNISPNRLYDTDSRIQSSPRSPHQSFLNPNAMPITATMPRLSILKDFSINGKIGDPQNDKDIGFLGSVRQIEEGREKGYSEKEIIAGVIRAIAPRNLRTYLGMMRGLKVPRLKQILRNHYNEKSATELYQELIMLKQLPNEDATAFAIRAMECREKILFCSDEDGNAETVQYDENQVQRLFQSTIESGIDQEVSSIIRPLLISKTEVDDVDLLNNINKAQASIQARKQKEKGGSQIACVKAITGETNEDNLAKQLRELMIEVSSMRKEIQEVRKKQEGTTPITDRRCPNCVRSGSEQCSHYYRCANCAKAGEERCLHCFRCGESNHQSRSCNNKPLNY